VVPSMTTWVLLRGLMREARHWGEFPLQFQSGVDARDVVTLDFPGNGSLCSQVSPNTVAAMADHCRNQLARLGYAPPYRVLALSLGAMVAVEWSRQQPAEVAGMVLINTSLAPFNPFYHRLRPSNYPALFRFLISGSIVQREKLILRITSELERNELQQAQLLERWESYARECPVTRSNILRQLQAAILYRDARSKPDVPLLLLAGKKDRLVNMKCSLALARKWDCAIKIHPAAGHDLPLDDGFWVTQQVMNWLEGMQGAAEGAATHVLTGVA
jgi:pimeloyl-ACP methyl ester carboxylesterase